MKQLIERTVLLVAAFFASVAFGWLAADTFHHLEVVLNNILASA